MLKDLEGGFWEAISVLNTGCDHLWGLTGTTRSGYVARMKLKIYILESLLREVEATYLAKVDDEEKLTGDDYPREEALFVLSSMREELCNIWLLTGSTRLYLRVA